MMNKAESKPIIVIAAGGTGGHVLPALVVARRLSDCAVNIVWIGTTTGLEAHLVPQTDYRFETISAVRWRGSSVFDLLRFPWLLSAAIFKSLHLLVKYRPTLVLGMGGFISAPVGLIAAALGIPLIIHEQNAVIGMTNRLLARLSKKVLLGFAETIQLPNATYVGNPVRDSICALSSPEQRYRQRQGAIRLLVIGGSQGAAIFNETVPAALALMEPVRRPLVKQQTGRGKLEAASRYASSMRIEIEFFEFADDVADLYAWADLVLCRAGALSVAEIATAGIASVLVPYPYSADDHQSTNAQGLVAQNAGILLPQTDLTPSKLAALLEGFVGRRDDLAAMAQRARRVARPQASDAIVEICMQEVAG